MALLTGNLIMKMMKRESWWQKIFRRNSLLASVADEQELQYERVQSELIKNSFGIHYQLSRFSSHSRTSHNIV